GERELAIHSRLETSSDEEPAQWTQNASGLLCEEAPEPQEPLDAWPPERAEPLEAENLYERLAEAGLEYGPAFQGLTKAWRRGEEVFAEVSLDEEQAKEADRFGLHPALLDSVLHALILHAAQSDQAKGELALPFAWSDVSSYASGATELRARLKPSEAGASISLADPAGSAIAEVGSLSVRRISPEQLQGPRGGQIGLLAVEWREASLVVETEAPFEVQGNLGSLRETLAEEGAAVPATVLWRCAQGEPGADQPERARIATAEALRLLQEWLAAPELGESRLAILTEGAVATSEEESPDPAAAAAWGLARSAQSEHPGRFLLIDTDGSEASAAALPAALAQAEEPQLALREGVALAPRASRAAPPGGEQLAPAFDPERTVLITGATGTLGALIAKHLVEAHGARRLLLASRSGSEAQGAAELQAELEELGATPTLAACDVSEREQLEELLASIPSEHPLGAVIHAAGALDDATIDNLTAERFGPVFAPKVDAAWHLHELTKEAELSAFVMFSSAAGTLGGPGQGNYAAASVFLDALAQRRRAEGLAGISIAWGLWESVSALTAKLEEADLARMRRIGVVPLSDERGFEFFDWALADGHPNSLAIGLDTAGLRTMASLGVLPPLLSGLVRVPKRRAVAAGSLAKKLAAMPEADREAHVLELVKAEVAAVLGHDSAAAIDPDRAFQELGFDSLAAVELRNRLNAATGVRLAPTVVFDYPSAKALATYILVEATTGAAAKVAVKAQASDEPIAIVGMSCRYPGGVRSPGELWELLASGKDAIEGFPDDRGWDLERLYNPDPANFGTSYAREGGFLRDAGDFDPEFFNISPREAVVTDPQQRLLLEGAWEALEDAGIDPASLRGTPAGVFAGVMYQDYGAMEYGISPGMTTSIVSGRVAYGLGFEGPTMTIDTACSSSLVALHLASQALRGGECTLALAGGVTVLATPSVFPIFSAQRGLAPDGRSKAFAEAADGVGLSEGLGVLALERLSDARANGHPVLATIKGSAVNQDGASNGLSAPNGPSQERVIRQALANARLTPQDIDAVEAHGTGTTLGDPIEAGALLATYGQEREAPLKLGSLKSNIGHAQAAAGVGGVIKTVMAMREGVLPKTLHVDAPSTKVDWEMGEIELLTEAVEWEKNGRPRRAGVSSFGFSGTNAHVILEEAPAQSASEPSGEGEQDGEDAKQPLPNQIPLAISAKTEPALRSSAERLIAHIQANPDAEPQDIAYSLLTTRSTFEQRAVAVGTEREQLLGALEALAKGSDAPNLARGASRSSQAPVFLFAGQGSQHPRMAAELLESSPTFARHIEECEGALSPYVDWSLSEVLAEGQGAWTDRLDIVQ
ncbi:MAG TPA: SDR family NAD(P)-dependent oxidoreductase, partial [Solirubrobacterales bacterium]